MTNGIKALSLSLETYYKGLCVVVDDIYILVTKKANSTNTTPLLYMPKIYSILHPSFRNIIALSLRFSENPYVPFVKK